MDCSLPGSSVHWIFQARILQWVPTLRGLSLQTGKELGVRAGGDNSSEPYEATRKCKTFNLYSLFIPHLLPSHTLTDASIHPVNNYSGLGILCWRRTGNTVLPPWCSYSMEEPDSSTQGHSEIWRGDGRSPSDLKQGVYPSPTWETGALVLGTLSVAASGKNERLLLAHHLSERSDWSSALHPHTQPRTIT